MDLVTKNLTRALHRLDSVLDHGSWPDHGESLRDWFRQVNQWDGLIKGYTAQLENTDGWSREVQFKAAGCYADYSMNAQDTLMFLEKFNRTYPWDGDFKCMMFNIITNTAHSYRTMAERLYRHHRKANGPLFTANFPAVWVPEVWCIGDCNEKKPKPKPFGSIPEWLKKHDKPIIAPLDREGTFHQTLKAWTCMDRTIGESPKSKFWTGLNASIESDVGQNP